MAVQIDSSPCTSCNSGNQKTFTAEIGVHFPGIEGLNQPIVWVFPRISVCLNCGIGQFVVPEKELEVLRTEAPVEGAAVWLGSRDEETRQS